MKFRAKLTDLLLMKQFSNTIVTLSRLSKTCVMRICPDKMCLIVPDESSAGSSTTPKAWCTLEAEHLFHFYKMEGVSETDNEILLKFSSDLLANSLSSLKSTSLNVKSVKMKLTNKMSPCLTFEIDLPGSHSRLCTHDVPAEVIPRRHWSAYCAPQLPRFPVAVHMPSLRVVRSVAERMRSFSQVLDVVVGNDGTLVMKVGNTSVNIATTFKDLIVEHDSQDNVREDTTASARVDIKNFLLFLASEVMNPTKIVCHVLDNQMVHMFLSHEDLALHYLLTVVDRGLDD